MDFVTTKELRAESGKVWAKIEAGEEIVITRNGKPFALMTATQPNRVEEDIKLIRRAHAVAAVDKMRAQAKASGLDQMTLEEINAEISAVRESGDASSH
jgi:antitoxin (DNA-binding transcriptional repressor) of toxin-antitoxin stability system